MVIISIVLEEIKQKESSITTSMLSNAIILLEDSIKHMMRDEVKYNDTLMGILHIQIALELFFKYYICETYGFEHILNKKTKNVRANSPNLYLLDLVNSEIKTIGFNDIFDFFKNNNDGFFDIKDSGNVNFFGVNVGYFDDTFDKFSKIRNAIVHSSYFLKENEISWLKSEFTVFIIFVIFNLLKHVDKSNIFRNYEDYKDLFETPIEVFKKHFSKETISILLHDCNYIAEIEEIASDIGNAYECSNCGKKSKVIDIEDTDGWSKCFYCGEAYYAGYIDCPLCSTNGSVQFDESNIEFNISTL